MSPKFAEDLEHTVDRSGVSLANPSFIGNREDIPEEQDPTAEVVAYNENVKRWWFSGW